MRVCVWSQPRPTRGRGSALIWPERYMSLTARCILVSPMCVLALVGWPIRAILGRFYRKLATCFTFCCARLFFSVFSVSVFSFFLFSLCFIFLVFFQGSNPSFIYFQFQICLFFHLFSDTLPNVSKYMLNIFLMLVELFSDTH